jgi:hypothetical protein
VLRPDGAVYEAIVRFLRSDRATPENLPFADQSLLSELFRGRWVALPWVYNGLKTMRWERVHGRLWYVTFSFDPLLVLFFLFFLFFLFRQSTLDITAMTQYGWT